MTRCESRISSYSWPTVFEPPSDDESALGKSLPEYAIDKPPAGQGVTTSRRSFPKPVDRRLLKTSIPDAGAVERSKPQMDVTEDNEIQDLHRSSRSTPKPHGYPTPPLWR